MAQILTPEGTRIPLIGTSHKKALTLAQMQKAVGGNIEPVRGPDGEKVICLINEEGQFIDAPINEPARNLIAAAYCLTNTNHIVEIRGNVIIPDRDNGQHWF